MKNIILTVLLFVAAIGIYFIYNGNIMGIIPVGIAAMTFVGLVHKLREDNKVEAKVEAKVETKFVLLEGEEHKNVFWTTDNGDYTGFKVLFKSNSQDEMLEEWKKYYYNRIR